MNKEDKDKKINISISVHDDILKLIEKFCINNKIKKSKFIEDIVKEYFKKV